MCPPRSSRGRSHPAFAMVCCENDMQFLALVCRGEGLDKFKNRDWVELTATVRKENCDAYQGEGPVLYVSDIHATKNRKTKWFRFESKTPPWVEVPIFSVKSCSMPPLGAVGDSLAG